VKTRRELILEEMGLGPTWLLREGAATAESPDAMPPAAASSPPRPSTVDTRAEQAPRHSTLDTRAEARPHRSSTLDTRAKQVPRPSTLDPRTGGDERRRVIMLKEWPALKADVAACTACALHEKRGKTVFGVGDENADWLFVGEGPGAEEDAQGEPFVGQAGKLLDNMLAAIKLKRGDNVYIANVVKCRPPGNRNPEPGEALACEPYLHRQIDLIRPKLIVALGKVAAANLLAADASVGSMRGRVHEYRGTPLIVTYHPAYLLRTLADKAKAWEDLCFAVRTMAGLREQALKT
jgi:uracil-DNA glycosylase family 4